MLKPHHGFLEDRNLALNSLPDNVRLDVEVLMSDDIPQSTPPGPVPPVSQGHRFAKCLVANGGPQITFYGDIYRPAQ